MYDSSQNEFAVSEMEEIRPLVRLVIDELGTSLGKTKLKELRGEDGIKTKAGKAIQAASSLSGIGEFILAIL